jgi:uncharacterized protein (TIGR02996 family)
VSEPLHAPFLAAIAARPDDDLPRLVYADWLDENGQPDRAEFIRTQVELATLPAPHPRRPALKAREDELLTPNKGAWSLPEFRGQSQVFRRGFVERVNVSAEWLVAHPDALETAVGPLRAIRIYNASHFVGQLAQVHGLARLEALDLTGTLFAGAADVRTFFSTTRLDRLRGLVVRNSNFWEGDELAALADTPVAARLRGLDVSGNRVGDAGVRVLAARPEFARLESFTYRGDEIDYQLLLHGNGAAALADSRTLTRLRVLDLGDQYLGDAGLARLVNSPTAATLERLEVDDNEVGEVGDSGVSAVVESPHLGSLKVLSLRRNRLGPLGAEALANWPHLEHMRLVDLRECRAPQGDDAPLGDGVRATLERSRWADKVLLD